jgi:hypothetical protein
MPFRKLLLFLTCLTVVSCQHATEIKLPVALVEINSSKNGENHTEANTTITAIHEEKKMSKNGDYFQSRWNWGEKKLTKNKFSYQKISTDTLRSSNYMKLVPTGKKNALGNPLYKLIIYVQGREINSYDIVSGRATTQNKDRHRSGTEAPLPDGLYKVAKTYIHGSTPEVGDRFLPIWPLFKTGRTDLGIHYDPSFEKNNGEDGTSGCIGLTKRQDLDQVLEYIHTYKLNFLEVKIQ